MAIAGDDTTSALYDWLSKFPESGPVSLPVFRATRSGSTYSRSGFEAYFSVIARTGKPTPFDAWPKNWPPASPQYMMLARAVTEVVDTLASMDERRCGSKDVPHWTTFTQFRCALVFRFCGVCPGAHFETRASVDEHLNTVAIIAHLFGYISLKICEDDRQRWFARAAVPWGSLHSDTLSIFRAAADAVDFKSAI